MSFLNSVCACLASRMKMTSIGEVDPKPSIVRVSFERCAVTDFKSRDESDTWLRCDLIDVKTADIVRVGTREEIHEWLTANGYQPSLVCNAVWSRT